MDRMVYDYKVKFYEEDGSYIDTDGFQIIIEGDWVNNPEEARSLANSLADDKADDMSESIYDAGIYEVTLEDAG